MLHGLERLSPTPGRLVRRDFGGVVLLDDSYNANPLSTEAALRSLAAIPAARRVAVLGEMAELGAEGGAEHARLGRLAADLGANRARMEHFRAAFEGAQDG